MRVISVLLIILLSYYAESKWDKQYSNREYHNGIEHSSGRPYFNNEIRQNEHNQRPEHKLWQRHDARQNTERWNYKTTNGQQRNIADPPDHNDLIPMARYVIHNADWASIATISTLPAIEGFPFTNVKSMVDGYIANSTGVPYFYMSPLDFTARDLTRDRRVTVLTTLEETNFCIKQKYDAEDPRCTRVMLTGLIKKVKVNSTEYDFAKGALFERHPDMASYPADHNFFVAKLKIAQISMVDWFGGAKYIPVRDYLAYNYTENDIYRKLSHPVHN